MYFLLKNRGIFQQSLCSFARGYLFFADSPGCFSPNKKSLKKYGAFRHPVVSTTQGPIDLNLYPLDSQIDATQKSMEIWKYSVFCCSQLFNLVKRAPWNQPTSNQTLKCFIKLPWISSFILPFCAATKKTASNMTQQGL